MRKRNIINALSVISALVKRVQSNFDIKTCRIEENLDIEDSLPLTDFLLNKNWLNRGKSNILRNLETS